MVLYYKVGHPLAEIFIKTLHMKQVVTGTWYLQARLFYEHGMYDLTKYLQQTADLEALSERVLRGVEEDDS